MSLLELERDLTGVVESLRATVVRIDAAPGPGRASTASGSGVVVDPEGLVVTNEHVVRGAGAISVSLSDGSTAEARRVGSDPLTDLALVKVEAGRRPWAPMGDSARLAPGQFVVAIGNALGLPGEPTVSLGVVSAVHRPLPGADFVFEGLLQTDAAINPGNSGGPLATLRGEVVGVTSAIVPFAQGVGFAVPSGTVRRVVEQLRRQGRVVRPWLGLSVAPVPPPATFANARPVRPGLLVARVARGGPADRAGVRPGDVLIRLGSTGLRRLRDLLEPLAALPIGSEVELALARGRQERVAVVRVLEAPALRRGADRG